MIAEELQIGDYIQNPLGLVGQVQSIKYMPKDHGDEYGDYYLVTLAFGESDQTFNINDAQPIPLTPEILEKNGFEKVPQEKCVNPFYWRFDKIEDGEYNYSVVAYKTPFRGFFFEIKNNCDCEPIVFTKQMESVHELQHALRICGITKEIQI